MIINHNLQAMNTHRQLGMSNAGGAKSMEKLSSGFRINRAGDDAAGLAISEKMRAQVRGLTQASRNAQDGISLIQTAEGALGETHAILQRMRELAVQASSDTNVDELDREAIQDEIGQLTEEINRIAETTEFNTQKLIDGSVGAKKMAGTDNASVMSNALGKETAATVAGNSALATGLTAGDITELDLKIDGANIKVDLTGADYAAFDDGSNVDTKGLAAKMQEDINSAIDEYNKANDTKIAHVNVSADMDTDGKISIKSGSVGATSTIDIIANATSNELGLTAGSAATDNVSVTGSEGVFSAAGAATATAIAATDKMKVTIDGTELEVTLAEVGVQTGYTDGVSMDQLATDLAKDINDQIAAYNATVPSDKQLKDVSVSIKDGAIVVESGSDKATSSIKFDNSEAAQLLGVAKQSSSTQGGGVEFQIGANEGQSMKVTIEDMGTEALGVADIDLSKKETAKTAITTVNDAINKVSKQRSALGAFQNRLEHTIKNLDNSAENLQAAESRIRDVDMAKEMMEQTKQNILQQAATAMLAQANQAPQGVLQLLR